MELHELRALYQKGEFTQLLQKLKAFEQTTTFQDTESLPFSLWVFFKTRALIQTGQRQQAFRVIQTLPTTKQPNHSIPVFIRCLANSNVLYANTRSVDAVVCPKE